jgi:hypothetical protein
MYSRVSTTEMDSADSAIGDNDSGVGSGSGSTSVKTSHHSRFIDDQLLYSTCVSFESEL